MERVALVTGGARGIGLGISEALAREGYALAVCGTRSAEAAAPQLEAVRRHGGEILYVQADVSQTADRSRLLDAVRARFGALHVLVNNAGVAPRVRADLLEASEESFGRVMRINLQGPYFLTQAAARWMVEQRRADASFSGCIVNIGSVSAEVASISRGEYCVAKAGMAMMTRLFASRLGQDGVPVYEVRPGIIRSDMTGPVQAKYDALIADSDLLIQKRWGEPEDVGRAVAVLARGEFPYSTGQIVYVDGGLSVQRL
ncbi:MAG: 3-ketoacyl-ACP reductase [Lentisphaerae bacterium]|jgi:NAD(P)-dependent dehydrogenase (short-subunit alcohol dehydrogenase family)|nr:3-ketoacyl-ACP reductase [Lentisphaerota bacterium]